VDLSEKGPVTLKCIHNNADAKAQKRYLTLAIMQAVCTQHCALVRHRLKTHSESYPHIMKSFLFSSGYSAYGRKGTKITWNDEESRQIIHKLSVSSMRRQQLSTVSPTSDWRKCSSLWHPWSETLETHGGKVLLLSEVTFAYQDQMYTVQPSLARGRMMSSHVTSELFATNLASFCAIPN
jgi:hypothetical protein